MNMSVEVAICGSQSFSQHTLVEDQTRVRLPMDTARVTAGNIVSVRSKLGLDHRCMQWKHISVFAVTLLETNDWEMVSIEKTLASWERMTDLPLIEDFICILQKCKKMKKLAHAKHVYMHIIFSGLDAHIALGNYLVPMLVACESVLPALQVLLKLAVRNESSWTSVIQGYIGCREYQHALNLFVNMQEECVQPSKYTLQSLLKACSALKCIERGQKIHAQIVQEGFELDPFIGSTLLDMYAKCGSLVDAQEIFKELPFRDVVSWTALIAGYAEHGLGEEALSCLDKMQDEGVPVDAVTFICILKACGSIGTLDKGHMIHADIAKEGLERDPFLGNSLLDMYAKCGSLSEARSLLDELPYRTIVSWNVLIAMYVEHGFAEEALKCLDQMQLEGVYPNSSTFICSLKVCGSTGSISRGQEMHAEVAKEGFEGELLVGNTLVSMYAKLGFLAEAQEVFNEMPDHDVVSWTALIAGYAEQGLVEVVLTCLKQMQIKGFSPNVVTFICSLKACATARTIDRGQELHAKVVKEGFHSDPSLGGILVDMYMKCGFFLEAQDVFARLHIQTIVAWNALVSGYAEEGLGEEALNFLEKMRSESIPLDAGTFVYGLKACNSIEAIDKAREIHAEIATEGFEGDPYVGNTLVDIYATGGLFAEALDVFHEMRARSVVAWTALIAGYADNGLGEEALTCLQKMQLEGVSLDAVTYACILKSCGSLEAIGKGQEIHAKIVTQGLEGDPLIGRRLVDLYAGYGSFAEALHVFDKLPGRNVVLWTALIAGYVEHGLDEEALNCLGQMQLEGLSLDIVMCVCCLKACGRIRGIGWGQEIHSHLTKYGFDRGTHVGNTLVEMYAKCGFFADAQDVLDELPVQNIVSWNAIIIGYAEHGLHEQALKFYEQIQLEGLVVDAVTFLGTLKACGSTRATSRGRGIHTQIVKQGFDTNLCVGNALVDMYVKCGFLIEAWEVLVELPVQDVVSWTALIAGYAEQGLDDMALVCLEHMQQEGLSPNAVTFVCTLKRCGSTGSVERIQRVFAEIAKEGLETDYLVGNVLVDAYAKCGLLAESREVFEELPARNVVSWTALIAGYAGQGESELVFNLFDRMREEVVRPDGITFLSVLMVCSHAGHVKKGQKYFALMTEEYDIAPTIEHFNCMVDLLSRAGQLNEVVEMLEKMPFQPDLVMWKTVLGACQKWGNVEVGRHAFECAVRLDGKHAATFILMCNIYADAHMWEDVQKIETMRATVLRGQKAVLGF